MEAKDLSAELSRRFRTVAVEGPIGVGKTTLVRRAEQLLGLKAVYDRAFENPLLRDFYGNMDKLAFATQVQFAVDRSRLWKTSLMGSGKGCVVVDFLPQRDLVFADNNLKAPESLIFRDLYGELFREATQPDAIVFLAADTGVLIDRIANRGIAYEGKITRKYLQSVSDAFHRFMSTLEGVPVLIVNTNDYDIVQNQSSVLDIFSQLLDMPPELRHYVPVNNRRT